MKKLVSLFLLTVLLMLSGCQSGVADKNEAPSVPESSVISETESNLQSEAESKLPDITSLEGKYYDSYSLRAYLTFSVCGNNSALITVHWSSSALEYSEWTMTASLSIDGVLGYSNEKQVNFVYADENATPEETEVYSGKEGYFELKDGALYWTGAYSEDCRSCVFEKAEKE